MQALMMEIESKVFHHIPLPLGHCPTTPGPSPPSAWHRAELWPRDIVGYLGNGYYIAQSPRLPGELATEELTLEYSRLVENQDT